MATTSDYRLCLIAAAVAIMVKKNKNARKKVRSRWVKPWLTKRISLSHINLLTELRLEPDDYRNYLRMNEDTYIELLQLVTPYIQKNNTVLRMAISPHERLSATFLATGRSYEDLKYTVIISAQALGHIIPETCEAICKALSGRYMKFPTSEQEWYAVANHFQERWDFPHCLGAVDGKHIRITCSPQSGSYFYNYKGFFSIVLLAIVSANYEFLMVNVGTNGRVSDGGVIENTSFYNKLVDDKLNIPAASEIHGSNKKIPFVFIGDEAFALRPNFLKPYSQKKLNYSRKIFNLRLSRGRNVVENAFGILASRFRIFRTEINMKLQNIERVTLACCTLHNFLRSKCGETYISLNSDSYDGVAQNHSDEVEPTFIPLQRGHNRHAREEAKEVRDEFLQYFLNEGQVSWQHARVTLQPVGNAE
ncbi:hypothetical protein RN001_002827 [Aquatica leii]|uniref:DDE Tnp4 domain-containing protein n=1 Tax=Aquatica leii TaxID=1421715 RepID=A0AAN7PMV8_9COLE|nr:hypothetical protein RN001_002827 [Aquatica leii]